MTIKVRDILPHVIFDIGLVILFLSKPCLYQAILQNYIETWHTNDDMTSKVNTRIQSLDLQWNYQAVPARADMSNQTKSRRQP